jgi:hypothetical protein
MVPSDSREIVVDVAASAAVGMFVYHAVSNATPANMDEVLNARLPSTAARRTRRRSRTPFERFGLALRQLERRIVRSITTSPEMSIRGRWLR